jgi:hypothetical protein
MRFKLKGSKQDGFGKSDIKKKKFDKQSWVKLLRIFIYGLLFLILLRGTLSFFKNDRVEAQRIFKQVEMKLNEKQVPIESETAKAFAESFTKEYLTYSNESVGNSDYMKRIKPYIASYLRNILVKSVSDLKPCIVKNVYTWKVEKIKNNQGNIIVKADVIYEDMVMEEEMVETILTEDIIFLEVPISFSKGKYVVDDYPAISPKPEKAEIKYGMIKLEDTSNEVNEEVSFMLNNFFKTYCMGNAGELSYYVLEGSQIHGYEGRFEYISAEDLRTYALDKEKSVLAIVSIKVKDQMSNMEFLQKYHMELIKKDGRWYIKDFDLRGGNLDKYEKGDEQK